MESINCLRTGKRSVNQFYWSNNLYPFAMSFIHSDDNATDFVVAIFLWNIINTAKGKIACDLNGFLQKENCLKENCQRKRRRERWKKKKKRKLDLSTNKYFFYFSLILSYCPHRIFFSFHDYFCSTNSSQPNAKLWFRIFAWFFSHFVFSLLFFDFCGKIQRHVLKIGLEYVVPSLVLDRHSTRTIHAIAFENSDKVWTVSFSFVHSFILSFHLANVFGHALKRSR